MNTEQIEEILLKAIKSDTNPEKAEELRAEVKLYLKELIITCFIYVSSLVLNKQIAEEEAEEYAKRRIATNFKYLVQSIQNKVPELENGGVKGKNSGKEVIIDKNEKVITSCPNIPNFKDTGCEAVPNIIIPPNIELN